jgi:hypothetical protein
MEYVENMYQNCKLQKNKYFLGPHIFFLYFPLLMYAYLSIIR